MQSACVPWDHPGKGSGLLLWTGHSPGRWQTIPLHWESTGNPPAQAQSTFFFRGGGRVADHKMLTKHDTRPARIDIFVSFTFQQSFNGISWHNPTFT